MSSSINSLRKRQKILTVVAILLGVVGLLFVIHGLSVFGLSQVNLNLLGDYLGGTTGSFWSAASLLVVYLAFIAQRLQLEMQNEEIEETKAALERQVFETTFFNLLNLHSSAVRDIDIGKAKGKDSIKTLFIELKSIYNNADGNSNEERLKFSVDKLLHEYSLDVSTYFNSLTPLLILLEGKSEDQYKYYSEILISQLSNYEEALLYYYGCADKRFESFSLKNNMFQKLTSSPSNEELLLIK